MPTGEQPAVLVNEKTTFDLRTVITICTVVLAGGMAAWQTKALADDVAKIDKKVEGKASKEMAEDCEKRMQKIEQFIAVQGEINKKIEKLDTKLDEALKMKK